MTTIARALSAGAARLAPLPAARLDAECLLAHVLGTTRAALLAAGREDLAAADQAGFDQLLDRRRQGEPRAYITGHSWFCDLDLCVGPAVLIPRPETELLAEWAVAWCQRRAAPIVVADVGTGSGALALAIAAAVPAARVLATDTSAGAVALARLNATRLGLADRVQLSKADLLPDEPRRFDLVVANLPYVGTLDLDLAPEVRRYEPAEALFAGPDGLDLIRRLVAQLPPRLAAGGAVVLEIGWRQGPAVVGLARQAWPTARVSLRPDLAGLDRLVTIEDDH